MTEPAIGLGKEVIYRLGLGEAVLSRVANAVGLLPVAITLSSLLLAVSACCQLAIIIAPNWHWIWRRMEAIIVIRIQDVRC